MARIRSIHPGQTKDEDFVALSPYARLLAIFLRNLADDRGVFEWKPRGIKMEVFPADSLDVEPLLAELLEHNQVCRYEVEGKAYGAIRNFRKWQRPEKPKYVHPFDDTLLSYVGLSSIDPHSEHVQSPTSRRLVGETLRRGRRKEEGGLEVSKKTSPAKLAGEVVPPAGETRSLAVLQIAESKPSRTPTMPVMAAIEAWNEICGDRLGRVTIATDARKDLLGQRLRMHMGPDPLTGWRAYCLRVVSSRFLTGQSGSGRPFKASFDWCCKQANAVKILEGNYDDDRAGRSGGDRFFPDGARIAPGTI